MAWNSWIRHRMSGFSFRNWKRNGRLHILLDQITSHSKQSSCRQLGLFGLPYDVHHVTTHGEEEIPFVYFLSLIYERIDHIQHPIAQVINCYYETWVFGPLMCDLYAFFGSLFGSGSIWTMTAIAFDRYNVIVKGLSAKPMGIKGALARILAVWLFSGIWCVAPMLGWNRYSSLGPFFLE